MMIIVGNQPKPLTGETLPALRQEISARLSLSYTGFVLAGKNHNWFLLLGGGGSAKYFWFPANTRIRWEKVLNDMSTAQEGGKMWGEQ